MILPLKKVFSGLAVQETFPTQNMSSIDGKMCCSAAEIKRRRFITNGQAFCDCSIEPHWVRRNQCDQIGRFIGLWTTF